LHSDERDVSSVTVLYASPLKFISQGYASSGSLHSLGLGDGLKFARVHHEAFPVLVFNAPVF